MQQVDAFTDPAATGCTGPTLVPLCGAETELAAGRAHQGAVSGQPATTTTVTANLMGFETSAARCCHYGGESSPSTNEQTSNAIREVWRKRSQLCVIQSRMDTELHGAVISAYGIEKLYGGWRAVGSFRFSSAELDSTMEAP